MDTGLDQTQTRFPSQSRTKSSRGPEFKPKLRFINTIQQDMAAIGLRDASDRAKW